MIKTKEKTLVGLTTKAIIPPGDASSQSRLNQVNDIRTNLAILPEGDVSEYVETIIPQSLVDAYDAVQQRIWKEEACI